MTAEGDPGATKNVEKKISKDDIDMKKMSEDDSDEKRMTKDEKGQCSDRIVEGKSEKQDGRKEENGIKEKEEKEEMIPLSDEGETSLNSTIF